MEKEKTNTWVSFLKGAKPGSKNSGLATSALRFATLPKRKRVKINLDRLDACAGSNENIVVPGKVLGTGSVSKQFTITAIELSEKAHHKLKEAGCKVISIEEMMKKDGPRILV